MYDMEELVARLQVLQALKKAINNKKEELSFEEFCILDMNKLFDFRRNKITRRGMRFLKNLNGEVKKW